MKYFLNTGTGKLHIEDFCYHAMTKPFNGMEFETEDEARRYAGDNLTWCKICERRKEQIFEKIKKIIYLRSRRKKPKKGK